MESNSYYLKNKEYIIKTKKEYHITNPWAKSLWDAKQRCTNPKNVDFKYYGGRGIEFHLTMKEGKILWNEAKAWKMKCPNLSRKNNDKNYTFDNCEFVEKQINLKERNQRIDSKPIIQKDLNGNFIKEYVSLREMERQTGMWHTAISNHLKGRTKSAYRYLWEYA